MQTFTTKPTISFPLIVVTGLLSCVLYLFTAYLSGDALQPNSAEDQAIRLFLLSLFSLFCMYVVLVWKLLDGFTLNRHAFLFALLFSIAFRLILLPTELILENDIYRYLWDGHVSLQGVNPYQYAPDDPAAHEYRTDYWNQINYPHIPTIYPPTLQFVYCAAQWVFPGSIIGMKFVLLLFDVGTIALLFLLLKKLSLPKEWCLIYAWSPLVVKEIANSGHADSITAFLLTATILLLTQKQIVLSAVVMACCVLTKFFGVLLLPLFFG